MLHDGALGSRWRGQHGVKGDDHRGSHAIDQLVNKDTIRAAEDAELMLDPDHIGAAFIDGAGGADIGRGFVGGDDMDGGIIGQARA
jgi:hypothetical protein